MLIHKLVIYFNIFATIDLTGVAVKRWNWEYFGSSKSDQLTTTTTMAPYFDPVLNINGGLFVDSLLSITMMYVRASGLNNFHPDPMEFQYMRNSVSMYDGNITGLDQLSRIGEPSMALRPLSTSVKAMFQIPLVIGTFMMDVSGVLNYRAGLATVYVQNVTVDQVVKFDLLTVRATMEDFRADFDRIDLKLEGLGIMLSGASSFTALVVNWARGPILELLNDQLKEKINLALEKMGPRAWFGR